MRRALACFLVLLVVAAGAAVGYFLLRSGGAMIARGNTTAAQQRVLKLLDAPPNSPPVPDNVLVTAAQRIEPAVVNIEVIGQRLAPIPGTPFERMVMMQGRGSGVIISPDGYVATNNHVVEGSDAIGVTMPDGRKFRGRLVGADRGADLAVVKIDGANLPSAEMGDSDNLKVGQYVLAIGYPLGLGTTVTHGIISATDRENLPVEEGRSLRRALQTDAPINRGNSGGALADTNGRLIGINTAIASERGGGSIGIGFAIPVNAARSVLREIIRQGHAAPTASPDQPFMGIQFQTLDPNTAQQYGLPVGRGVVVLGVVGNSPADAAGIAPGTVISTVDGQPVQTADDLRARVARHRVGDRVTLGLIRGDGSTDQVQVPLVRRPPGA